MKIAFRTISSVLCFILVFSLLFMNAPAYAYNVEEFQATGIVKTKTTDLNVRSGPGTEYEVIQQLPKDTFVNITGITKDANSREWYRINANGYLGYAAKDYIEIIEIPSTPDEAFEATLAPFPESYKEKLRILHALHPTWLFTPLETGLSWETLMKNECITGRNLLQSPKSWLSYDKGAYDWENNEWYTFDSGGWSQACVEVIAHYLDPRNFFDSNIYQFLVLSDDGSEVKPEVINEILKGTFMYNAMCNDKMTYAEGIISAGKEAGASPYMLAARIVLEQGSKGNDLAHGSVSGYEGYYNHFDIGAYRHSGNSAILNGAIYAKNKGWNTPYKAILGGAQFLVKSYVGVGQNTLYLQKFDVVDGGNGLYGHQYMTNVSAAATECATLRKAIENSGADSSALTFLIPVYSDMPETSQALPLRTGSANNYLTSLSVEGSNIDFDMYTHTYEVFTENTQVVINAKSSDPSATIEGIGNITLEAGISEAIVTVTATNGLKREYRIIFSSTAEKNLTSEYEHSASFINGVEKGTLLSDFKTKIQTTGYTLKFTDAKGNEKTDEQIMMTGDCVRLFYNDTEERVLKVVIYGDSSGDGKISLADLLKTQGHILGLNQLENEYFKAADLNKDGVLKLYDLLQCQKTILES